MQEEEVVNDPHAEPETALSSVADDVDHRQALADLLRILDLVCDEPGRPDARVVVWRDGTVSGESGDGILRMSIRDDVDRSETIVVEALDFERTPARRCTPLPERPRRGRR